MYSSEILIDYPSSGELLSRMGASRLSWLSLWPELVGLTFLATNRNHLAALRSLPRFLMLWQPVESGGERRLVSIIQDNGRNLDRARRSPTNRERRVRGAITLCCLAYQQSSYSWMLMRTADLVAFSWTDS
jgi:hypothetical protein